MGPAAQGALVLSVTLLVLLSGAPVAFALGVISIAFHPLAGVGLVCIVLSFPG